MQRGQIPDVLGDDTDPPQAGATELLPRDRRRRGDDACRAVSHSLEQHGLWIRDEGELRAALQEREVDTKADDDWAQLWWIRVVGAARVHEAGDAVDLAARPALALKYHQYAAAPPAGPRSLADTPPTA